MKAIILTYDERHFLAELVIKQYDKIWPQNDFIYYVPYNHIKPTFKSNHNIVLIKTDKGIKATLRNLLNNINNDEFVFWCFDDIYPVKLYYNNILNDIAQQIGGNNISKNIDAIRLIKRGGQPISATKQHIDKYIFNKLIYDDTKRFFNGFWFHYFIRANILRRILLQPDNYTFANIKRQSGATTLFHNIYVPQKTLGLFAETTRNNILTYNCVQDLKHNNINTNKYRKCLNYAVYNERKIFGADMDQKICALLNK